MTPARRIARVQRWLAARGLSAAGNAWVRHQKHWAEVSPFAFPEDSYKRFYRRIDHTQSLFSAELAWLCEYANRGLH